MSCLLSYIHACGGRPPPPPLYPCVYPPTHPPQAEAHGLAWVELQEAAQLARLSGLCYVPPEELEAQLQAEGLSLLGQGRDKYTSWCGGWGRG